MRAFTIIYFMLGVGVISLAITQAVAVDNDVSRAKLDYTKFVCDKSRTALDSGDTARTCGQMQAQTHTEYICNNTGTSCWLEVR